MRSVAPNRWLSPKGHGLALGLDHDGLASYGAGADQPLLGPADQLAPQAPAPATVADRKERGIPRM